MRYLLLTLLMIENLPIDLHNSLYQLNKNQKKNYFKLS